MLLAVALRQNGIETIGLVGAQYNVRLLSVADLEAIGITVHIATDDGSSGHHGYVTDLLTDLTEADGLGLPDDLRVWTARHVSCCYKDSRRFWSAYPNRYGKPDGMCTGGLSRLCVPSPHRYGQF